MGDIYASAVGTTVLQLKEIPERPAEFEGLLTCNQLQEPANTTDATLAEMITLMLAPYGQVQSCDLSTDEPRNALVRFASHMEAAAAQARASHAHLCAWIALKYNERPYDERGWCIFEDAVSSELVVQCRTYPKMRAVLDALPPKLVRVSSHAPPTPIVLRESEGGEHIEAAVQRILHGTFTGSGDKPKVVNLYKTYVGHIVRALQETLAFAASDAEKEGLLQIAGDDADELPAMGVPPAPLLKLAENHGLLVCVGGRAKGSAGDTLFACVDASGAKATSVLSGQQLDISFDLASHITIPWDRDAGAQVNSMARDARKLPTLHADLLTTYEERRADQPSRADIYTESVSVLRKARNELDELESQIRAKAMQKGELASKYETMADVEIAKVSEKWVTPAQQEKDAARKATEAIKERQKVHQQEHDKVRVNYELTNAAANRAQTSHGDAKEAERDAKLALAKLKKSFGEGRGKVGQSDVDRAEAALQSKEHETQKAKSEEEKANKAAEANAKEWEAAKRKMEDAGYSAELARAAMREKIAKDAVEKANEKMLAAKKKYTAEGMMPEKDRQEDVAIRNEESELNQAKAVMLSNFRAQCIQMLQSAIDAAGDLLTLISTTIATEKMRPLVQKPIAEFVSNRKHEMRKLVKEEMPYPESESLAVRCDGHLREMIGRVARLDFEKLLTESLFASGAAGLRVYGPGQKLMLRQDLAGAASQWVDAEVVEYSATGEVTVAMKAADGSVAPRLDACRLHPWNHAPQELPVDAFEVVRQWYNALLLRRHASIIDALSGRKLDVFEQCLMINVDESEGKPHPSGRAPSSGTHRRVDGSGSSSSSATEPLFSFVRKDASSGERITRVRANRPAIIRQGAALESALAGGQLAQGQTVVVLESQALDNGTIRFRVGVEGEGVGKMVDRLGWVTGVPGLEEHEQSERARRLNISGSLARRIATRRTERSSTRPSTAGGGSAPGGRPAGSTLPQLRLAPSDSLSGSMDDARGLAQWLQSMHAQRLSGGSTSELSCGLLMAGPASGKTTMMSQVVMTVLGQSEVELVPILVKVQRLQKRLVEDATGAFDTKWNWIDAYLCAEHGEQSDLYRMLRQAMMARRALILLDGLDEGGAKRDAIERHVTEVLAPQGHVMLTTTRPAGVNVQRFEGFRRLSLAPLTSQQQETAVNRRLGAEKASLLLPYLQKRVPIDADTNHRVTSNPLLLSMVISLFEIRQSAAEEMPTNIAELYGVSTQAMLSRAHGVASGGGRELFERLVKRILFQGHLKLARELDLEHINDAAAALVEDGAPKADVAAAVTAVLERITHDQLPLLSLLQADPLRFQAAHLSFQEFFSAQEICNGYALPTPPWNWPVAWANTLRLGREMGEPFGAGLLKAATHDGNLNLARQICRRQDGAPDLQAHRQTAIGAVALMATFAKSIDVSGNSLSGAEMQTIGERLLTEKARSSLKSLTCDAFTVVPDVTEVRFHGVAMHSGALTLLAGVLNSHATLTLLSLVENDLDPDGVATLMQALPTMRLLATLQLSRNAIGVGSGLAIGGALGACASLGTVKLGTNALQDEGVCAIMESLARPLPQPLTAGAAGKSLSMLSLYNNGVGPAGAAALAQYLAASNSLTHLELSENSLGCDGAKALAAGLRKARVLSALFVHSNQIGKWGAQAMAEALGIEGCPLVVLDIGRNHVGDEGALAIASAIRNPAAGSRLMELRLYQCSITQAAAQSLVDACVHAPMLKTLNMIMNTLGDDASKRQLAAAAKMRKGLTIQL